MSLAKLVSGPKDDGDGVPNAPGACPRSLSESSHRRDENDSGSGDGGGGGLGAL